MLVQFEVIALLDLYIIESIMSNVKCLMKIILNVHTVSFNTYIPASLEQELKSFLLKVADQAHTFSSYAY